MTHVLPQFELQDSQGSTVQYSGSVTTTLTALPASPDKSIGKYFVRCAIDQTITKRLYVSLNSGTDFVILSPGEWFSGTLRGSPQQSQIHIKGNAAGVQYEAILDMEP